MPARHGISGWVHPGDVKRQTGFAQRAWCLLRFCGGRRGVGGLGSRWNWFESWGLMILSWKPRPSRLAGGRIPGSQLRWCGLMGCSGLHLWVCVAELSAAGVLAKKAPWPWLVSVFFFFPPLSPTAKIVFHNKILSGGRRLLLLVSLNSALSTLDLKDKHFEPVLFGSCVILHQTLRRKNYSNE